MRNASTRRMLIVGIFIFIGLLFFGLGVFTVGSQHKTFSKALTVRTILDDVSGLHEGNNVWLSGVKIGVVKKISFYGRNQVEVTMAIDRSAVAHVAKDAFTKIGTDGLIGNRIVVIAGGTKDGVAVEEGDFLRSERTQSTDDVMNTLQQNNKNLIEITENLKDISGKIRNGEGTLGSLVNSSSIADQVHGLLVHLQNASIKTEKTIDGVNNLMADFQRKGTLYYALTADTSLANRLKSTMDQLQSTSTTLSQFAANLDQAGKALKRKDNTAGVLLNDPQTAADLKTIIRNLKSSSVKLDEDLEAAKHSFLLKGYFKKQEKEEKKSGNKQDTAKAPPPGL